MEPAKTDIQNGMLMPAKPLEAKSPEEIIHWLQTAQTPLDMVETRDGRGGQTWYYIRHQYVTDTLNRICRFNWDLEILREYIDQTEDQISVVARLTVRIGEVTIIKEAFGGSDIKRFSGGPNQGKPMSIADDLKGAASDALKKCATLLGLGLDLSIPIQDNTRRGLHAVGKEKFGDQWDKKRALAVRVLTGGRKQSSNDLLDVEARVLKAVIEGDFKSEVARELAAALRG